MFNSCSCNSVVNGLAALGAGLSKELLSIKESLPTCNHDLVANDLALVVSNGYPFHIKKIISIGTRSIASHGASIRASGISGCSE